MEMQTCDKIHMIPPSMQTPAIVGSYACRLEAWSNPGRFCNISTEDCPTFIVKFSGGKAPDHMRYCILAASFDNYLTEIIYEGDTSAFKLQEPSWHDVIVKWYIGECLS